MKTITCSLLVALALAGCGGSSQDSSAGGALTGDSTCTEWVALRGPAATEAKNAYLKTKDVGVGKGSEGEALSAWIDYLCGATAADTPFSPQTGIDEVFDQAKKSFTTGPTLPPAAATKPAP